MKSYMMKIDIKLKEQTLDECLKRNFSEICKANNNLVEYAMVKLYSYILKK
jgi:hypothetical protein